MNKQRRWILPVCLMIMVAVLGVLIYVAGHYLPVAGTLVRRDAQQLDLQGREISPEEYAALQRKLPECEMIWDVPFQGGLYPSTTDVLFVSSLTDDDVAMLRYFPQLNVLDGTECEDYAQLRLAADTYPDCDVIWQIHLGGERFETDTESLSLYGADVGEVLEKLDYLPNLTHVSLGGPLPEAQELIRLCEAYPSIAFHWELVRGDRTYASDSDLIDLSGIAADYEDIAGFMAYFPGSQTVDMRGSGLSDEEMMALADAYPEDDFLWNIAIGNISYFTGAEEIDISNRKLESVAKIEDLLPYFSNLRTVIMSHCGIDDEAMDALNRRYEDIRFIWSVKIKDVYVRTDAEYFYPYKFYHQMRVNDEEIYPLRYCTDLVAIDVGHMTYLTNVDWAENMTKLTYLIVAESHVNNVEGLRNCKNLKYLELFGCPIQDYSPLVECTALEDLNLAHNTGDHTPLMKMTWLKNFWWSEIYEVPNAAEDLRRTLTETNLQFDYPNAVGHNGWRELPNYKRMRDIMGMFYLK